MRFVPTILLVCSALALPATARAADDWTQVFLPDRPVTGGNFGLTVGGGVLRDAKTSKEVRVQRSGAIAIYSMPLARGQRTPADIRRLRSQVWRFSGTLSWRRNNLVLRLDRIRISSATGSVSARLNGKRMRVAQVDKDWFSNPLVIKFAHGYWPARSRGEISLARSFRVAVRRVTGRTAAKRIRGAILVDVPSKPRVVD